jgi:hypothetical protein
MTEFASRQLLGIFTTLNMKTARRDVKCHRIIVLSVEPDFQASRQSF